MRDNETQSENNNDENIVSLVFYEKYNCLKNS